MGNTSVSLLVRCDAEVKVRLWSAQDETQEVPAKKSVTENEEQRVVFSAQPGRYVLEARRKGFYSKEQSLSLTEKREISVSLKPRTRKGFEPHEERNVFSHNSAAWDAMAPDTDPRWDPYRVAFSTPYFTRDREDGFHRITSHREMLDYIGKLAAKNENMRIFQLQESTVYGLDIPLVLFSKDLPRKITGLEEAGEYVRRSDKPVICYLAQIHGNEPAAGEAALGMMAYLSAPEGQALLEHLHVYVIPRMNPDGAMLYRRVCGKGLDLNRDFFSLQSSETRSVVRAFCLFQPCLVLSGHEYKCRKVQQFGRYEDIKLSAGISPNVGKGLTENSVELLLSCMEQLQHMGLRTCFYGDHISGRGIATDMRYTAERGAMMILIESRGIDMGQERYHRRVMGHFTTVRHCLETIAANPEKYRDASNDERSHFEAPFDRDLVLEGAYTEPKAGDLHWPIITFDYDTGKEVLREKEPVPVYTAVVRTRPRPVSYILPRGKRWEGKLLKLLSGHQISWKLLPADSKCELRRFVRGESGVVLAQIQPVLFPLGAIEISVSQQASHIISFLFEADCLESESWRMRLPIPQLFCPEGDFDIYRRERT